MNFGPIPSPLSRLKALLFRNHAIVFLVAILAQSWILALPFQFDDYGMLADPLALFGQVYHSGELSAEGPPAFMMRFTLWLFWALGRACSGDLLSPIPFHASALLLHGLTSLLLARLVTRLAPAALARTAGLLAGLTFALSTGGIQAVSWAAAQSDLLFPLFALLAAGAFFDARQRAGVHRSRRHWLAFAWTLLALWSKAPAFLVPPVLFFLLFVKRPATSRGRALFPRLLRSESAWLAAALSIGFLSRYLYLGTFQLRYQSTTIDWASLPQLFPKALQVLGQALYPWNQDPVFQGDGPRLAQSLLAGAAPSPANLAALLYGSLLLSAFLFIKNSRKALLTCLLLALFASLPSALISNQQATNVIGRTTYFPLLFAWSAIGLALAAWLHQARPIGIAALTLTAMALLDTRQHVVHTEELASAYQRAAIDSIEATQLEYQLTGQRAPLTQIVILPDNGLGGIPALGYRLHDAFQPPFHSAPALDVRVFETPQQALESLGRDSLARHALRIHGREWKIEPDAGIPEQERGRAWRDLLAVRPWGPLRPAYEAETIDWSLEPGAPSGADPSASSSAGPAQHWLAASPVPAHALAPLMFIVAPGPASSALLTLNLDTPTPESISIPIALPAASLPRRLALLPYLDLRQTVGPPIKSITWTDFSELLLPPQPLAQLPKLEPLSPAPNANIPLQVEPPSFQIAPPPDWSLPAALRLELRQLLPRGPRSLYSDHPLPPNNAQLRPLTIHLDQAHIHPSQPPTASPPPDAFPWIQIRQRLLSDIQSLPHYQGALDWRVTLLHPSGHPATQSPRRPANFLPDPSFP